MAIDALSLYNTYAAGNSQATDKYSNTLNKDYTNATDEELMEACKEFESYFVEQVFKSMQKMVPKHEYMDSSSETMMDYFKDELISQYAKTTTEQNSLGLAQILYEQMKRNVKAEDVVGEMEAKADSKE